MIRIEKTVPLDIKYPLSRLGREEDILFFDIETTGLSAAHSMCYLIGCLSRAGDRFHFAQWLAEDISEEETMLREFAVYAAGFRTLLSFNGETFDLPFLTKRADISGVPMGLDSLESVDIYKKLRPFKALLGLPDMKQKSLERFLGINREDRYSGGELIQVYFHYRAEKKPGDLRLLLLHNEEDVLGMVPVLSALSYPDFFAGDFSAGDIGRDGTSLTFSFYSDTLLPVPVEAEKNPFSLRANGHTLTLTALLREGELRRYYEDYRNYYYLPAEDTAVHKSVGEFVDKSARVKATRSTCYTRVCGTFFPEPSLIWEPALREDLKSSLFYCPLEVLGSPSPGELLSYCRDVLAFFIPKKSR